MKPGGELEVMHLIYIKCRCLPDDGCNRGGSLLMNCPPGEFAINFLTDLTNQDAFDIATRSRRKLEAVDLLEQSLYFQNHWPDFVWGTDMHERSSGKNKAQDHR